VTTPKHGHNRRTGRTKTYDTWAGMIRRVRDRDCPGYGSRGITVCERWKSFDNFLADMGTRPSGMTIDRENNDGNYEPGNCRWANQSLQNRNRRTKAMSGYKGVHPNKKKWAASISFHNRQVHLGTYVTKDEAAAVYGNARRLAENDQDPRTAIPYRPKAHARMAAKQEERKP